MQDNFWRKIIAWNVSWTVSSLNTAELLRKACATLRRIPTEPIELVVDGGPEKNNAEIERLLEPLPLEKLIAQTDIVCSNSMIEAMDEILKYQYLFQKDILDVEQLPKSVEDFDDRPNDRHRGLTPDEAHVGEILDQVVYHERIDEAGIDRRLANRSACPPRVGTGGPIGLTKTDNEAGE